MKLIFTSLVFLFFSLSMSAQNVLPLNKTVPADMPLNIDYGSVNHLNEKYTKTRSGSGFWLNYVEDYRNVVLVEPQLLLMTLFSDSNIVWINNSSPFYYYALTMVDPYHMNDFYDINSGDSYTLDSVGFRYSYTRKTDASVVDTLFLSVVKHTNHKLGASAGGIDYSWEDIRYDYINNELPDSQIWQSFTYLLTEKDSTKNQSLNTTAVKEIRLPVSGIPVIDYPNTIGLAIRFKAGYPYTQDDSISGKNAFSLLTSKQQAGQVKQFVAANQNVSFIVIKSIRYNYDGLFNGRFAPSWAYGGVDAFENHYMSFYITSIDKTGVNDLSIARGINFSPNPVSGRAFITYQLTKNADKTSVQVFDISGREIISVNNGAQSAGEHTVSIDFSNLKSGMYFYSFTADGNSVHGKFIVN